MSNQRYPEEFKIEAVKQVTERGLRVADGGASGVSAHSLYAWVKRCKPQAQRQQVDDQQAELRRLRAELKRVTEERDILKRPPRTLPRSPAEVRRHQQAVGGVPGTASLPDPPGTSQRLLRRLAEPKSAREKEDQRLLGLIKHAAGKRRGLRLPQDPRRPA